MVDRSLVILIVGWMLLKVGNEAINIFFIMCPNHKNVTYVCKPEKKVCPYNFQGFFFFVKLSHEKIGKSWCHPCAQCRAMLLDKMFTVEDEVIHG